MEWNWFYLIPIGIAILSVLCWLIVFLVNYKTTNSINTAASAASEAVKTFKGAISMFKIRGVDGTITIHTDETAESNAVETAESNAVETKTSEEVEEAVAEEVTAEATVMSVPVEETDTKTDDTEEFFKFLLKLYNAFKE